MNVIARALGWAFIGALAGTADGWRKMSFRVGRNGFIGGLIGGLLGGATFEIVPYLMVGVRSGAPSRFFGFLLTGAMIGLFVALVQEWLKEAWIRVVVGRNEGKEFLVEKERTAIGRAELSDIPLFGDPRVARRHAVVAAAPGGGFLVADTGESPLGVLVNGARIDSEQRLRSGDQIQIADRLLIFFEKSVKERSAAMNRDVRQRANVPAQPGVSPYALPQQQPIAPPATPRPMGGGPARLVATGGPHTGQSFTAASGASIGRDPGAELPVPSDTKASRRHARLVQDSSGWAIEDLGSTNGTFVNGQRITKVALAPGDTIVIGSTTLRFDG